MVTLTNKQNVVFEPNKYVGLSTDQKPMPGGEFRVNMGDEFFEMDTNTTYWFDSVSNEWIDGSSALKHFGVKCDLTTYEFTRIGDAEDITTDTTNFGHFGSVNPDYDNPFDSIYPWKDRKLCNIDLMAYRQLKEGDDMKNCVSAWEGDKQFDYNDECGVWVYTPPFYGKSYDEDGYRYFDVSMENTEDSIYYPAMITGRWLGCDVVLAINGVKTHCNLPTTGVPIANVRLRDQHTLAKNCGVSIVDIYSLDASVLLYVVEYANLNSQSKIGKGVSDLDEQSLHLLSDVIDTNTVEIATHADIIPGALIDIGTTDGGYDVARTYIVSVDGTNVILADKVTATTAEYVSVHGLANVPDSEIGSASGYIGDDGKCNAYYRGECLYGNKHQYVLGAYREKNTNKVWLADPDETDDFDTLDTTRQKDSGYTIPTVESSSWVYVGDLALCEGLSIPPFMSSVGSVSNNPTGDMAYLPVPTTNNTIMQVGGRANDDTAGGLFLTDWYRASSNSAWSRGSRPRLKTPKKSKPNNGSLVGYALVGSAIVKQQ